MVKKLNTFENAFKYMKQGGKVKRKNWNGYWYWSSENNTIMIHLANGEELDIRDTEDVNFTFTNIIANDWEIAYVN